MHWLYSAAGADDDGSGSMSILEAYRALIAAGFRPERTVEFHWYSAEVRLSFCSSEAHLQRDVATFLGRGAPRISGRGSFL